MAVVALAFVLWASLFIRESSFISADGVRRFCLLDDAMVSMRYAWNLAHGQGLVWNPGERVEGITNLLMTLIMAPFVAILPKEAAVVAVQGCGILFVLLTAHFSWRVSLRAAAENGVDSLWLRILVFAVALTYYPLAFWALLGMETGLLAALVSAALFVAVRQDGVPRPSLALAVLLGLALLTRPDAIVFVAVIQAYRAGGLWPCLWSPRRGEALRSLAVEVAVIAAFALGVSVFRLVYYRRLTPNTALLKLGGFALRDRLPNGLGFVGPFLESTAPLLLLALLIAALDLSRLKLAIGGLVLTATAYQVWVGGDLGRVWRMMTPAMPLFCGLLVVEIAALLDRRLAGTKAEGVLSARPRLWAALRAAIVVLVSVAAAIRLNAGYADDILLRKTGYLADAAEANRGNVDTALALRELALPGMTIGVSWAGAIPFYSELPGVDLLGKCDPHIAALPPDLSGKVSGSGMRSVPGHNKYDLRYSIQQRQPTYIQEYRWGRQNLREWVAGRYVSVVYRGALLCLLENSPHVDWRRVSQDRPRGCDESVTSALWSRTRSATVAHGGPTNRPQR
jgi:arabinofuranosyltransferase